MFGLLNPDLLKGADLHGWEIVLLDPGLNGCNFFLREVLHSFKVDFVENNKDWFIFEEGLNGVIQMDLL